MLTLRLLGHLAPRAGQDRQMTKLKIDWELILGHPVNYYSDTQAKELKKI
jgi:hypothetical protein